MKEIIRLDDYSSISAIVELGELYKKMFDGLWVYDRMEMFISNNIVPFMSWWDSEEQECIPDTDLALSIWWEEIGSELEINKHIGDYYKF